MNHPSNPIRAGNEMPAPASPIATWRPPEEVPQRKDYVKPEFSGGTAVLVPAADALTLHRFLEVNAVYPEEKDLADRLRAMIEGR